MSESANPAGVSSAVIFRSAGGLFAVPMQDVIEINSRTDLTPLPCLHDYILGVINLMGSVTPVIDLRRRLAFEDCEYGAKLPYGAAARRRKRRDKGRRGAYIKALPA